MHTGIAGEACRQGGDSENLVAGAGVFMKKGYVVSFNSVKAWGFIREVDVRSADVFFHVNSVENRISLRIGDAVVFDVIPSKAKPDKQEAVNIRLVKREAVPSTPAAEVRS